jgi:hypothetical protein
MSDDESDPEDNSVTATGSPPASLSSGSSIPAFYDLVQKSMEQWNLDGVISQYNPHSSSSSHIDRRLPTKIPLSKLFNFLTVDEWMPHLIEKSGAISQQEMELSEILTADSVDEEEQSLDITTEQILFGVDIH